MRSQSFPAGLWVKRYKLYKKWYGLQKTGKKAGTETSEKGGKHEYLRYLQQLISYDEDYECYVCMVDLDEDEMSRFLQGGSFACSFYQRDDEYAVVRKQM